MVEIARGRNSQMVVEESMNLDTYKQLAERLDGPAERFPVHRRWQGIEITGKNIHA